MKTYIEKHQDILMYSCSYYTLAALFLTYKYRPQPLPDQQTPSVTQDPWYGIPSRPRIRVIE